MQLLFQGKFDAVSDGEKPINICTGNGDCRYEASVRGDSRHKDVTLRDTSTGVLRSVLGQRGIFGRRATMNLLSGDAIRVHMKGEQVRFEGCDWVIRGDGFPRDYFIEGGYGKLAVVQSDGAKTKIELSLTAVEPDLLCGIVAVMLLVSL